ncbi:archaetidylserine decarboxylase [Natronospira bacteriovora]|uniref:Phosphatidylserine decarboxylase proenzyme n=1 Tax=Natronospira bacteriovora TaxID=3069753 RepID=A0ABU0W4H2_9GAMM|nr:archaetidylserine decarboxylase [Natronospira sp. AB-CW4]MDQ2068914.1 archaetidylserine decarboxylase [Natronospira sp. AB-CW4]
MTAALPPSPGDYAAAWPQYLLPQHLLSRVIHRATRSRRPWLRDAIMQRFLDHFEVNLDEAEHSDLSHYDSFNAFFTRALKSGARPLDDAALVSPVDGRISQLGSISGDRLFQAKGRDYGLEELLGNEQRAQPFLDGQFATIYLAPHNYHRIHMPVDGTLTDLVHLPGRLFSVNPRTTRVIPRLFARNERVAACFDTAHGPMAMVLVGALLVGSIETVWTGEITPPTRLSPRRLPLPAAARRTLGRGDEMGRFNMGSTVILLMPKSAPAFREQLFPGAALRLGQALSRH